MKILLFFAYYVYALKNPFRLPFKLPSRADVENAVQKGIKHAATKLIPKVEDAARIIIPKIGVCGIPLTSQTNNYGCRFGYEYCNFEYGSSGFCKDCVSDRRDCVGRDSNEGQNECLRVCAIPSECNKLYSVYIYYNRGSIH